MRSEAGARQCLCPFYVDVHLRQNSARLDVRMDNVEFEGWKGCSSYARCVWVMDKIEGAGLRVVEVREVKEMDFTGGRRRYRGIFEVYLQTREERAALEQRLDDLQGLEAANAY